MIGGEFDCAKCGDPIDREERAIHQNPSEFGYTTSFRHVRCLPPPPLRVTAPEVPR